MTNDQIPMTNVFPGAWSLVISPTHMIYPTALQLTPENRLLIDWSDGQRREYRIRELRDACPCATCREKRNQPPPDPLALPLLKQVQTQPLTIAAMEPMGNYAYSIRFSDGHDTGIFAFDLLRQLGQAA
jgi:DUF971 family protein